MEMKEIEEQEINRLSEELHVSTTKVREYIIVGRNIARKNMLPLEEELDEDVKSD